MNLIYSLAIEAIEKREAHDEDCQHLRTELAKAKRAFVPVEDGVQRRLGPQRKLPDNKATNMARATVDGDPSTAHVVGMFVSNAKAFYHRRKWSSEGYLAWTRMEGPARYAVYAQKSPG